MEPFDTNPDAATARAANRQTFTIEGIEALKPGTCARIALHNGDELAIYNVNGEYYATDNSCPHRGAPLSEGTICGDIVECALHGWQFDVRTGECLTVSDRIKTYRVTKEEGQVRIVIE
jgi:nitrite reductase/ring-hydroxylating ferredoxin subunit